VSTLLQQFLAYSRRNVIKAVCLSLILLTSAASYSLWHYQRGLVREHTSIQQRSESMLRALAQEPRITTEIANVAVALQAINQNLIREEDLADNLGYFYQAETISGIRLTQLNQLSAQPPPLDSLYKSIPFTLQATGSYVQIIRFLRELETGPRQLKICTYTLSRAPSNGDPLKPGTSTPDLMMLESTLELLGRP
jgi:Tfp pilus assembly protein PilO